MIATLRARVIELFAALCLGVALTGPSHAQSAASAGDAPAAEAAAMPAESRPAPLPARAQLEALLGSLSEGRERLLPMLETIDTAPAEAWLNDSPLQTLAAHAADDALPEAEKLDWQSALDHEQAGAERINGTLDRARLVLAAPGHLDEAVAKVEGMLAALDDPSDTTDAERALSQIEQSLAELTAQRAGVLTELETRRDTVTRLREQWQNQPQTIAEMREDLDREQAAAEQADTLEPQAGDARRALAAARVRRAEARLLAAELDAAALPARIERLELLIAQQEVEGRWLSALIRDTESLLAQRSTEELRALSAAMHSLIEREPSVQSLHAAELNALRAQIDAIAQKQQRTRSLQQDREEYLRLQDDLAQTMANVNERLAISGLTETLGGQFLEEQRRLRSLGDLRFELQAIQQALVTSRLDAITFRERLRQMPAPAEAGPDLGEQSPETMLARIRHQIASTLVQSEAALTEQLARTEARLSELVAQLDELERILTETLLWWPSHSPVSLEWAARLPAATLALLDLGSWNEIRDAFVEVTVGRPLGSLLTLLIVGALYRGGRRAGPHLRALAEKTRHRFLDNIGLTFRAMGWSLIRVAPVPALLMSTSLRLERIPESAPGVEILAAVLFSAAIWWLAGHLVLLFISRNGVGTVHFGWNPVMLARLRRQLAWYLPTQFLLIVLLALAFGHPHELVFDVFGRAALIAASALTGFLAWRLLAPNPDLTRDFADRKRRVLRLATVTFSGGLMALALSGYLLTVGELFARMIDTVVVVGLVGLGYRVAARALILSETRLRLRRMLEQRAKNAAAEANSPSAEHTPEIPEPLLSMEDINQQTRTLVKVVAGSAMVVALFVVWADILPALNWLDGVPLWSRDVVIDGETTIRSISLQDMLFAIALVALFTMATRNLPGLVEIVLARSTDMDGAGRYTITTLLRYAIMVVATVSVFSLLGLRWGELQWMIAALTLGLGFGLQEVVANFVSGLIMLFERPVRVGDTITIGEFSGTVARIRTRATTIIDWDNREVVVPNKMFITERLINWTLSDTITRIVLPVSVNHKSDPDLVIDTLRRIAVEHPLVMTDPAPNVLFVRFGDSALHFEMRAYVKQLRERLETVSDLHRSIVRAFRELGIEIAFQQIDLHIRDLPEAAATAAALRPEPAAAMAPTPAPAGPREAAGSLGATGSA